jgi:molecular chaperone DnaK
MLGEPHRRLAFGRAASVRPEEVCAFLIARARADAERALDGPITDAVLTVPASFDFAARRAMRDAGRIAGLHVPHVLNEPTAAALAYRDRLPIDCMVLVFGLGGGAFDASMVRLGSDCLEVRATLSSRELGGWDWDNLLMRLVQDRLTSAGGPDMLAQDAAEARLRARVRAAKHRLSSARQTEVVLRQGPATWRIPVSRSDFESATARPLGCTRTLVERVLTASRIGVTEIDRVLLVGGATRMVAVSRMLRLLLGRPLEQSIDPEEAVALGAARYDRALRIREVASHGLGVLARSTRTGSLRNVTIVPSGSVLPATDTAVLTTGEDEQDRVVIDVTLGDGAEPERVRTVHREVLVFSSRRPAGTRLEVRCGYDAVETPWIDVREVAVDGPIGQFVVRGRDAMTELELTAAIRRMSDWQWC